MVGGVFSVFFSYPVLSHSDQLRNDVAIQRHHNHADRIDSLGLKVMNPSPCHRQPCTVEIHDFVSDKCNDICTDIYVLPRMNVLQFFVRCTGFKV